MELGLRGKAALVTGSSRGIGRAIAEALLLEGARVCLCARGKETLAASWRELAALGEASWVEADVSTPEGALAAIEATVNAFGGLDILVNNVGGSRGTGAVDTVDARRWREVLAVNLDAAFLCSRGAIEKMKAQGGGCIVNLGSIYGREYATSAPYTVAKAGVIALSKEMAVDLAQFGIRVNCVAPGSIFFPGGSWDRRQQADPQGVQRLLDEEIPWRRFGTPEEVAAAVVFLCSTRASWITGACLPVDGGQGRAF